MDINGVKTTRDDFNLNVMGMKIKAYIKINKQNCDDVIMLRTVQK